MKVTTTIRIYREDETCWRCGSGGAAIGHGGCPSHNLGMSMEVTIEAEVVLGEEYAITNERVVASECDLVSDWEDLHKDEREVEAVYALIEEFDAETRTAQAQSDALASLADMRIVVESAATKYVAGIGTWSDDELFEALGRAREALFVAMRAAGVKS